MPPVQEITLSAEERQEARTHWDALMPARSAANLAAARDALRGASPQVRQAVLTAIVEFWRLGRTPSQQDNPF
jgi:uncharacterized membrane protein